jgi:hypothetical protein
MAFGAIGGKVCAGFIRLNLTLLDAKDVALTPGKTYAFYGFGTAEGTATYSELSIPLIGVYYGDILLAGAF